MVGAQKNTCDYYQAMDAFTFPSLYEGLGISVIEAQTSGLPCYI
jgi:glycosyltransferase involved in cell wall biosynthesis